DPTRCARLWVAVAVATLWLVQVGGVAVAAIAVETLPPVATVAAGRRRPPRLHRVFRQGLAVILAALAQGQPLPQERFLPEEWPETTHLDDVLTEESINQT